MRIGTLVAYFADLSCVSCRFHHVALSFFQIRIMAPQDSVGRIHKRAFVTTTSVMYAIAMIAVILRLFHRTTHKQLDLDDAILSFGAMTLTTAFIIIQIHAVDRLYLVSGLDAQIPGVIPPGDPPGNDEAIWQMTNDFHNWMTVTLALSWGSILAAKFTFLILFWKLIDRINKMKVYWYIVFVFNVGVCVYSALNLYLTCPYFNDRRLMQCNTEAGKRRVVLFAFPAVGLDILGDILSKSPITQRIHIVHVTRISPTSTPKLTKTTVLVIPFTIIWKIRIRPSQKLALLLSLGLTAFIIVITIILMSGLEDHGQFDYIWESFWVFVSGSVGTFMAAAIAFRTIFVARSRGKSDTPPVGREGGFGSMALRRFRRWDELGMDTGDDEDGLPSIPGARLSGVRTLIDDRRSRTLGGSERSKSTSTSIAGTEDALVA
ncbi:hypothetical protein T440DRAFT_217109 [Plenodomus tracheiphilus IPT5]|uniref:Integral membrane protein n=1 Tax=Plenodomus tracheiphilus IPT5 TaxID=1408161 RepID=A0A6A7AVH7_9PLEO|nr:hypothetical protein T440DRAFT_217109 [Plenodomus tracheiphilus IPT5]